MTPHTGASDNRGNPRRSVFRAVAAGMTGLGLVAGTIFPGFVVLLGVPAQLAFRPVFVTCCLAAGIGVAAGNYALVRLVIGKRLRLLVTGMATLEQALRTDDGAQSWGPDGTQDHYLNDQSRDEIGASARAFNRLFDALVASWQSKARGSAAISASASSLHAAGQRIQNAAATALEESVTACLIATEVGESVHAAARHAQRISNELTGTSTRALDLVHTADTAAHAVAAADTAVQEVATSSQQLAIRMDAVESIARQIHLHALNAGIEATRTSQTHSGFRVIAEGISALALRTSAVIAEITTQVSDNQRHVTAMADAMETLATFTSGVRTEQAAVAERLAEQVQEMHSIASATAVAEQDAARIGTALSTVSDAITLTIAATSETRSALDDLVRTASDLGTATWHPAT